MKLSITKRWAMLAVMAIPTLVWAAPTVTFQGEVTDQTCQAVINGETSSIVLLPTVSAAALASAGATAGLTPFTLQVSECQVMTVAQAIGTVFLGHNVTAAGNLGNRGTATNVAIQLTRTAAGDVPVVLDGPTRVPGLVLDPGQTTASHQFAARYISEAGGAGAGSVQAVAEYTLTYL